MKINYNATAMIACNSLTRNENNLSASTAKLSSGYKINRAQDNPSGYALSRRMRAQIAGLSQSGDNASDGANIIETADGALSEVQNMLQRINELCVQAGNGTLSDVDRSSIDVEIQQMKDEIQRVSDETEFNGQTLLNGTFALRGYTDNKNVKVQSYDSSITAGKAYSIGIGSTDTGGVINFDSNGYITTDISKLTLNIPTSVTVDGSTVTNKVPADAKIESISDNGITITGSAGFSVTLALSKDYDGTDVQLDLTGLGAMTVQIGANEGQTLDIDIPDVGISALGMTSLNAKTQDSATEGIGRVSKALEIVSAVRGKLGAYQNRLESTGRSNDTAKENMTSALSNITDVDMAEEYSTYATYQILQQASTSVLSQANKQPSDVLQLLQ